MSRAPLLAAIAVAAGAAGGAPAPAQAPELRITWIAADGSAIGEEGALGVHGLAPAGEGADGSPARFRLVLEAPPGPPSFRLTVAGVPASGGRDRDALRNVPLEPFGDGRLATPWLVAVASLEDRRDPALAGRAVRVRVDDRLEARLRRGGGRALRSGRSVTRPGSEDGGLALRRAAVEAVVLRAGPGGPPLVGGDEAGAAEVMRFQAEVLNEVLAPCAVWVGPPGAMPVRVADPAPAAMIAVGDPLGLPSAGGVVRLRIDGRRLEPLKVGAGYEPEETARLLAARVAAAGFRAQVSVNPRAAFAAGATADVVVLRPDGAPAEIASWEDSPVTTDASQPARIVGAGAGPGDGPVPGGAAPAAAGERALAKVFGSGRPGVVTVLVVDGLAGGRRQGQALPGRAESGIVGALILDWRALWRTRQAFALPHEIAHLLLGDLGHTDERGDPDGELLMHSRASSVLDGPRRLTAAQCGLIRQRLERGL